MAPAAASLIGPGGDHMMAGTIMISNDSTKRRFVAVLEGVQAYTCYATCNGAMTFTHTYVPDALQQRGVTTQLIRVALAQARENGWRVTPLCRYVAAYMKDHPETHDMLTPAGHRLLGR